MIIYEWHTVQLITIQHPEFGECRTPDLSVISGATGAFASAVENGAEMLCLVEIEDGV